MKTFDSVGMLVIYPCFHAQLDTSSGAQSLDGGPSDGEPAVSPMRNRLGPNLHIAQG